ncbi:hypothetical protein AJ78_05320 [Emergomyces pasteurianus Ep9510]|uniref:Uncharacterized protein n=1 Tax=Emergomyces pasteurianus Ep9510 TaxID=1447872 RepID=A0A1J9QGL1_9EURO|nr:hypothetical protein AJ78_05320 [Emergomyces pasteurianus Ep9510]
MIISSRKQAGAGFGMRNSSFKIDSRPFNVLELQRTAVRSVGANICVTMTKLAEGSFNKTLSTYNGQWVRCNRQITPKYYTTASEVATIDFEWNARVDNPVGAEYIIMEEAVGTKLEDVWDELPLEDRITIMKDLVLIENNFLSVSLSNYGHLYHSSEPMGDVVSAEITNDVSRMLKAAVHQSGIILKPPANFKGLEPAEKAQLRKQIASSVILYLHEQQTAKGNPCLDQVLRLKLGRKEEIHKSRANLCYWRWHELGFDFACPIHFTEDELQRRAKDGEGWNEVQGFWRAVEGIVTRDGWTSHDMYDTGVAVFLELREIGSKNMVGKDRKNLTHKLSA